MKRRYRPNTVISSFKRENVADWTLFGDRQKRSFKFTRKPTSHSKKTAFIQESQSPVRRTRV